MLHVSRVMSLSMCVSILPLHLTTPLTINGLTIELNVWRANGRYLKVLRCDKLFRQIGLSFSPFEGISKQGSGQSKQSQEWQHPLVLQGNRGKDTKESRQAQKDKKHKSESKRKPRNAYPRRHRE